MGVETNVQSMTMVKMHTGILTFQYWFDNEIIFGESLALGLAHSLANETLHIWGFKNFSVFLAFYSLPKLAL